MSNTDHSNSLGILILIDSGALDYCFADKSLLTNLTLFKNPTTGLGAGKGSIFTINRRGNVELQTMANGIKRNITFKDVLYAPNLRSNLISVSKLGKKGMKVIFNKHKTIVKSADKILIMKATCFG